MREGNRSCDKKSVSGFIAGLSGHEAIGRVSSAEKPIGRRTRSPAPPGCTSIGALGSVLCRRPVADRRRPSQTHQSGTFARFLLLLCVKTRRACLFVAIVAVAGAALAQNTSPPPSPPPQTDQPAPLFDGQIGTKSSTKDKESATLGFNGIDPSGNLDQKMLATSATPETAAKAKKMTDLAPSPADVDGFIKEGGLNKR